MQWAFWYGILWLNTVRKSSSSIVERRYLVCEVCLMIEWLWCSCDTGQASFSFCHGWWNPMKWQLTPIFAYWFLFLLLLPAPSLFSSALIVIESSGHEHRPAFTAMGMPSFGARISTSRRLLSAERWVQGTDKLTDLDKLISLTRGSVPSEAGHDAYYLVIVSSLFIPPTRCYM